MLARHLMMARAGFFALLVAILLLAFLSVRWVARTVGIGDSLSVAGAFLFLPRDSVDEYEDRTNILLLGKAGTEPELTDTLIVVSVGRGKETIMISVPRDIWVPGFGDKINSGYWRGNAEGNGLVLARSAVEEVIGKPIAYTVTFSFEGFIQMIDILGGVEVEVERAFVDTRFPIPGRENDECGGDPEFACRYETISFEKGKQVMDGETALKFVRSRHSEDPTEGTDLARAARQQKVVLAIKEKVLSAETLFSPSKIFRLWRVFWRNVETDLTPFQMAYIARLVYDSRDAVSSYTIPGELLYNPPYTSEYNFLYVFIPAAGEGNWRQVHEWVSSIF